MKLLPLVLAFACAPAGATEPVPTELAPGFWAHWGDGRAELDGYRLRQPRYGEVREGQAVLVYVTETFTLGQRVKSDGGHPDEVLVLKLNEVRDFPTGIYDYNLMTSSFVRLDAGLPLGVPTKVSFSAQEWCGLTFDELVVDARTARRTWHSYFDGEADGTSTERLPEDAVYADTLPIVVRGWVGQLAPAHGARRVTVVRRLMDHRLGHLPGLVAVGATVEAGPPAQVTVPAGSFEARPITVALDGGPTTTWDVELAAPFRVVRWQSSDGEQAELTGSIRTAYWKQHDRADEGLYAQLGLPPRPGGTDPVDSPP